MSFLKIIEAITGVFGIIVVIGMFITIVFLVFSLSSASQTIKENRELCQSRGFDTYDGLKATEHKGIACCDMVYENGVFKDYECKEVLP